MSLEVHKHIEERLIKNKDLFYAKVLNFPNNKKLDSLIKPKKINNNLWKINDKSNNDQLKAVVGVCFVFGALILMGLYSNLM